MSFVPFPSLEPVLRGGIPRGDQILISGPPGSGKSILSMQFIYEGIKHGENGVFFTLDSEREYLINQMKSSGIDVQALIDQGKMDVVELDPHDIYVSLDEIERHVKRLGAKRLVLDSLSILFVYCGSYRNLPEDMIAFLEKTDYQPPISMANSVKKQMLYSIMRRIRGFGCTSILISELSKNSKWYSRDTISEFACDGIILLDYHILGAAGVTRTLSLVKMRRSDYSEGVHEFRITDKGISIQAD
ncbi:MAG: ATPase domain-containing protein [Candidatus Micrarchaeia archaeon]